MTKTVSAYKARTNLGEIINEVYYKEDEVIIKRMGKPMVKIVPLNFKRKGRKPSLKSFLDYAGVLSPKDAEKMKRVIKKVKENSARPIKPL